MQYAPYGKTGLHVSRFGLGCMRYPKEEQDAIDMVRYAIDHGVNYLDTAYVYGDSEVITGKALQGGYRDKTYLATKCPVWDVKQHADFEKYLDEELIRLQTDYVDVYLLHNLNQEHWEMVKRYDGFSFLDKMVKKGKIRHEAFSIHNTLPAFIEIADAYPWEMAQIQLNILDEHQQVGIEGVRYAAQKGMAVVIMEPLRGGSLVNNVPMEVQKLISEYPEKRSLVEWCFRWLYNMPEVSTILSGASSMEQLKDNLRIFSEADAGVMSEADQELICKIQLAYEANHSIGCTGCKYCMPCPKGVGIPDIFKVYNSHQLTKPHTIDKYVYQNVIVPAGAGAEKCVACGVCQKHCPQSLNIPELLKAAQTELTA